MLQSLEHSAPLSSDRDPAPTEVANPNGGAVLVLTCEHAGRHVPAGLRDLGIPAAEMDRHIAYDIGAEGLARRLADALDAPLVLQRFSRLVVDCNRPFDAPDCFPSVSDGTRVPANEKLSEQERRRRFEEIHQPFHRAVARPLDRRASTATPAILISIHSFTPQLTGGETRPGSLAPCPMACDLGYLVTLVPDACATMSEERHQNSLRAIKGYCRQVTTDTLIAEIERRN
jgi:predicted N-formylglutamate amidohydrolase